MPKKKQYKINLNYDEKIDTLSGIFGITKEELNDLMSRFQNNLREIAKIKPRFQIAEVIHAGMLAAENDSQYAYIFFRIGKEHEQENMAQAAAFAEKVIIPGLIKPNGKKTLN